MKPLHILTLLVDNEFGVLTRITALIRRFGWNINSLTVCETSDRSKSQMVIDIDCFHASLEEVVSRLQKLDCVHSIKSYNDREFISRELLLLRVFGGEREKLEELTMRYGGRRIDSTAECVVLEFADSPLRTSEIVEAYQKLGTVSVIRTGPVTIERAEPTAGE